MREGALVYCSNSGRMDVRCGLEDYYGGLHCSTGMDVLLDGRWKHTRIEMRTDGKWYLVGVPTNSLIGLRVRVE